MPCAKQTPDAGCNRPRLHGHRSYHGTRSHYRGPPPLPNLAAGAGPKRIFAPPHARSHAYIFVAAMLSYTAARAAASRASILAPSQRADLPRGDSLHFHDPLTRFRNPRKCPAFGTSPKSLHPNHFVYNTQRSLPAPLCFLGPSSSSALPRPESKPFVVCGETSLP